MNQGYPPYGPPPQPGQPSQPYGAQPYGPPPQTPMRQQPYIAPQPHTPFSSQQAWQQAYAARMAHTPVVIAGPADRESFFKAQRRYRWQTWQLSVFCYIAVFTAGIPLSITITPLLCIFALLILAGLSYVIPGVKSIWPALQGAVDTFGSSIQQLPDMSANADRVAYGLTIIKTYLPAVALLVVPGIVVMFMLWFIVRAIFRHAGVGSVLLSMGVREPRMHDLEERQLSNIVAEMALAAGLPVPRVALLDKGGVNAAIVGTSEQDAVVVVSRRLLDECDRQETQGFLAHAIGGLSNGDLRVAFTVSSIYITLGLLAALLKMPFGRKSRAAFGQLLRLIFTSRRRRDYQAQAGQVMELLQQQGDDNSYLDSSRSQGCLTPIITILRLPLIPIALTCFAADMTMSLLTSFLIDFALGKMWQRRRLLADATAVQLTREPNGLARALSRIPGVSDPVPGAGHSVFLFVVPPGNRSSSMTSFHPKWKRRIEQLVALGAQVPLPAPMGPIAALIVGVLVAIFYPILIALMGIVFALVGMIVVFCLGITFGIAMLLLHFLPTLIK